MATAKTQAAGPSQRAIGTAWGGAGVIVAALGAWGGPLVAGVVILALLGTPLFAILGGSAELAFLNAGDEKLHHLRFIATKVMDERFAGSPILVTIPLFTFVGYVLAEAKTPDRIVHAARAILGWLPGGLAIVCVVASAVFTVLTGGSGVTIIAIGGLLYPALRKQGYSDKFSLGLVTTGGSVGLLLPYSLPLLVYCLVAHVEFTHAFKAVLVPGALVVVLLSVYSAFVATQEKVRREPPRMSEVGAALWELRWELFIPVLLILGLGSNLAAIDEVAALVALYVAFVEFFVYRDLSWKKDLARIAGASMSLAGAIILILAMANALMNFVEDQEIPKQLLELLLRVGIEHKWQLLLVMNLFLLVLGMLMEGFSAIFVAVPLIMPFVANLGERHPDEAMSPFQLAMIFLLNLELAYCVPPLGLNLFISSFRFNRSVTSLYKVVLPFAAILAVALMLVSYVPKISTVLIDPEIAQLKAAAAKDEVPPREAWNLECVQLDPMDPKPCSPEDRAKFGVGHAATMPGGTAAPAGSGSAAPANDDMAALNAALSDDDGGEEEEGETDASDAGDAGKKKEAGAKQERE